MAKKVAVIGAGVSGLISLKCCVEEGLEPICFERTEDIGGLWRFKENVEDGQASIYQSVITNTSKEMSCFSDFPMPEDFPNFLHNSKLLEYFRIFAKKFDLLKYIQFQTTVLSVKKPVDFLSSGQWEVVTESKGREQSTVFDAVMVCSGHHILPRIPLKSFPGIERFKGQYFHSRQYKHPEGFERKRILVIGIGNSASDIAVELSKKAAQVFMSTRQGSWVMSRISDDGYPWDMVFHTRFLSMLRNVLPRMVLKWMMEQQRNRWFNHANYGLEPQNNFGLFGFCASLVVNENTEGRQLSAEILTMQPLQLVNLKDVVIDFTQEEWALLHTSQRKLFRDVMLENISHLVLVGHQVCKKDVRSLLEQERNCGEKELDFSKTNIQTGKVVFKKMMNAIHTMYLQERHIYHHIIGGRHLHHLQFGTRGPFRYLMKEPILNDDLPSRLLCGAIKVKSRVTELTETSAIFEDGTVEEDIDVIVFATGYTFSFPFLEESLVKVEENMVSLYKYMFPPHLEKPTLACLGLIQPLGSTFPTVELQARWATRVFKGLCALPSESTMMVDIIKRKEKRIDLFGESLSQILQTNYIDYLDELALEIGVKPDLFSLLLKDPKLAVKLYFGPCNSYQYRLVGPGQWEGARSAIFTQKQRILKPLKTRALKASSNFPVSFLLKILGFLAIVVAFLFQLQWFWSVY